MFAAIFVSHGRCEQREKDYRQNTLFNVDGSAAASNARNMQVNPSHWPLALFYRILAKPCMKKKKRKAFLGLKHFVHTVQYVDEGSFHIHSICLQSHNQTFRVFHE